MKTISQLLAVILAIGATPAFACGTTSEQWRIDVADLVIDGVATCDVEKGTCILRSRTVVKDSSPLTRITPAYRFYFEPGAAERYRRELAERRVIVLCDSPPWQPTGERMEGRFYLRREAGRLVARQPSGREIPEGEFK